MWCEYGGKDRGKAIRCEDGGRGRKREMEIAAFVLCLCLCNMEARMRIGAKLCDVKMEAEKRRDGESSVCVVFIFVNMEVGMRNERCEDGGSGEEERWREQRLPPLLTSGGKILCCW